MGLCPPLFVALVKDVHMLRNSHGSVPSSNPFSTDPASSSLAQSVMSMASSQISTDTVSSMSGSYIAPGTEEEGEALPSPLAASRAPSEGEVREVHLICLALCFTHGF